MLLKNNSKLKEINTFLVVLWCHRGLSHSLELQKIVTLETCTLVGTYMYGRNGKVVCCTHVKRMVCKDLSIDGGGAAPLISKFETNGVELERS